MRTIIILALLCIAIFGAVIYFFVLDERKDLFSFLGKKQTQTQSDGPHVDTSIFREGLQQVSFHHPALRAIYEEIHKKIIGMEGFINAIIINMLCGSHMLIEGVPGLAKTKTVQTFSEIMGMDFKRIQFTPDMLPADIIGVEIYDQASKNFEAKIGPIMANIILADEINRATPKVQSALLEAMQEQQVTIGGNSFSLPDPFFVLATQNPLEQEGTYPLPEAQIDRFLFKILVNYPSMQDEKKILDEMEQDKNIQINKILGHKEFFALKDEIQNVKLSDQVKHYITRLMDATRNSEHLLYGASPRGSIGIMIASKALAFCEGKDFVSHEDVQRVALAVLRHRVILSYEAKTEGMDADEVLVEIFGEVGLT